MRQLGTLSELRSRSVRRSRPGRRVLVALGALAVILALGRVPWERVVPWMTRSTGTLPKLATAGPLPVAAAVISVSEECAFRVSSGEEMTSPVASLTDVAAFVDRVVAETPGKPFIVNAHVNARYTCVDEVFALLRSRGVERVHLASD